MRITSEELLEMLEDVFEIEAEEMNIMDEFKEYEEWDSLALLSLIATVHDEFNINLSNSDIDELKTIKDLLDKINNHGNS